MLRGNVVRGGILCVLSCLLVLSCGERTPTEPDLPSGLVAVAASEVFTGSPQLESRELLIDGRATDIEWNVTGDPTVVLLRGNEGRGGDYFASVRALWTIDPFNGDSVALYLLVQWGDPTVDFLEQPLITSLDWQDADGNSLVDCSTGDPLHDEANWRRASDVHEDQVEIEIFSNPQGGFPADRWRWGLGTTDPATPVPSTEFVFADPIEIFGGTRHPTGAWSEDYYNSGSGWVRDAGRLPYEDNFLPGSSIPLRIVSKGQRDTRLNRGKPVPILIWKYVSKVLEACDSLNPVRLDDASVREKTWNPGDYVPSFLIGMPDGSQRDVVSKGAWENGKWALELRRLLRASDVDTDGRADSVAHNDDVELHGGQTYGFRLRIYNASKTRYSESPILPLYLKPRT